VVADLRSYLDRYFESYVDNKGQSVDTITVCSYQNTNFLELKDGEFKDLRSCSDAIIFSVIAPQAKNAVCANNNSFGPPSSDAFELITQNFQMDNDYVHVRAGSLLSAGRKIGEVIFSRPWSMGGSFGIPDSEIVKGFGKCFSLGFPQEFKERLFRSLEWFRLAHTESEQISELSKIVMVATGFEILLEFPKDGKRRYFTDYVENNISSDKFARGTRTDHKGKSFEMSLASCWAWDFYNLRSTIVHGDSVPYQDLIFRDWITHLIVSDLVFLECTKRELFRNKCIGDDVYSCNNWGHILIRILTRFEFILENLVFTETVPCMLFTRHVLWLALRGSQSCSKPTILTSACLCVARRQVGSWIFALQVAAPFCRSRLSARLTLRSSPPDGSSRFRPLESPKLSAKALASG